MTSLLCLIPVSVELGLHLEADVGLPVTGFHKAVMPNG